MKHIKTYEQNSKNLIFYIVDGQLEKAIELIKSGSVNLDEQDEGNNDTALILASKFGYNDIVKTLIKAGANLDLKNKFGNTALMKASQSGVLSIAKELINAGANLDLQNKFGNTALILASYKENYDIVRELIKNNANWNIKNIYNKDFTDNINRFLISFIIDEYPDKYKDYLIKKEAEKYTI